METPNGAEQSPIRTDTLAPAQVSARRAAPTTPMPSANVWRDGVRAHPPGPEVTTLTAGAAGANSGSGAAGAIDPEVQMAGTGRGTGVGGGIVSPPEPPAPKRRGRPPATGAAQITSVNKYSHPGPGVAAPAELTDVDLANIGEITRLSRKNGMAPSDYMQHLQGLMASWDKMVAADG